MRHRLMLLAVLVGLISSFSLPAAADEPKGGDKIDLVAFGKLPVMFNGRVTNIDHYAKNLLRQISGAETWPDENGNPQPAVTWVLDRLRDSSSFRERRYILADNPRLRKFLELKPTADARYCSLNEALPKFEALHNLRQELLASTKPWTADDEAFIDFARRVLLLNVQRSLFELPKLTDKETVLAGIEFAKKLDQESIPFLIPPRESGSPWRTLQYGVLMNFFEEQAPEKQNPAGTLWTKLIAASRESDASAFNQAVQTYSAHIEKHKLRTSPYQFTAPPGWSEVGVPFLHTATHFDDASADGTTVTVLDREDPLGYMSITINYFPNGAAAPEQIVNSWRWYEGLAPLPASQIKTQPVQIAGQPGWRITVETPPGVLKRRDVMFGASFSVGKRTWVICCSIPAPAMKDRAGDFDLLLKSIAVDHPEQLESWFKLEPPEPYKLPAGARGVLVVVPDQDLLWTLRTAYPAEAKPAEQVAKLKSALQSLRPRKVAKDDATPGWPFAWQLPDDWKLTQSRDKSLTLRCGGQMPLDDIKIDPLSTTSGKDIPALINRWRSEWRLPPRTADELKADMESLTVEGREILIITAKLATEDQ